MLRHLKLKSHLKMHLFCMAVLGHMEALIFEQGFLPFLLHTQYIKLSFTATAGIQDCLGKTWMTEALSQYVALKKNCHITTDLSFDVFSISRSILQIKTFVQRTLAFV